MSQLVVETTTTATFVVRFWREWSGGGLRWRGRIEHAQSGQAASFLDIEGLLEFLERFGIDGEAVRKRIADSREDGAGVGRCEVSSDEC
jgi:hypothetical protein